jgi:hypothetical protein
MTDREFVDAFEGCTLPEEMFHHRDHIRLAWIYLITLSLPAAMDRFSVQLRAYAESLGKAGLYHETISWAFLLLVHDRISRAPVASFEELEQNHGDLFRWNPSVLDSFYDPQTLASPLARRTFLFPDRSGM